MVYYNITDDGSRRYITEITVRHLDMICTVLTQQHHANWCCSKTKRLMSSYHPIAQNLEPKSNQKCG